MKPLGPNEGINALRHPDCRFCDEYQRLMRGPTEEVRQLEKKVAELEQRETAIPVNPAAPDSAEEVSNRDSARACMPGVQRVDSSQSVGEDGLGLDPVALVSWPDTEPCDGKRIERFVLSVEYEVWEEAGVSRQQILDALFEGTPLIVPDAEDQEGALLQQVEIAEPASPHPAEEKLQELLKWVEGEIEGTAHPCDKAARAKDRDGAIVHGVALTTLNEFAAHIRGEGK